MTATEEAVLRNVVARLRGGPGASEAVNAALADPDLRIWLDSWVVPALEYLLPEQRDPRLALRLSK